MRITFFDREDESGEMNGSSFESEDVLVKLLDDMQVRSPFFCELAGENDRNLLVGLGGETGCVQFSATNGMPPYWMAVGPATDVGDEFLLFVMGGTSTPISARYELPFELVKEIAKHFLRTGERSPAVIWEEI